MKLFKLKIFRILCLAVIVALLLTQTDVLSTILRPREAYAVGDLNVNWGIGSGNVGPIFSVNNMAPGASEQRTVNVQNGGTIARTVAVKGIKTSETGSLGNAMTMQIKDGATVLYNQTLTQFFTDSLNTDGIPLTTVSPGTTKTYTFIVTFLQNATNEFQNKTVQFDIVLGIATEIPAECSGIDLTGKFPIFGTEGNDRLRGTGGDDVIIALGGNDTVLGRGGNDCIVGGDGNDDLRGETGDDLLFGNAGSDELNGGNGKDTVFGGTGNDEIDGGSDKDTLHGEEGNDKVDGGSGDDTLNGGDGNDTMDGGSGNDAADGQGDNDIINGKSGNDVLIGGQGTDAVNGSSGTDTCVAETETSCEL